MKNKVEVLDRAAFPIEPLRDTWDLGYDVSWGITLSCNSISLSTDQFNTWLATAVANTLDAFAYLARLWKVVFTTDYMHEAEPVHLEWNPENSYEEYIKNVLRAIRAYPDPIYRLEIKIDMGVYVRTKECPDEPMRAWVRYLGEFMLWGEQEESELLLIFKMGDTLFCPSSKYGVGDNIELYALNHPLLEQALRLWEQKLGAIDYLKGPGIYKYGFLPDDSLDAG